MLLSGQHKSSQYSELLVWRKADAHVNREWQLKSMLTSKTLAYNEFSCLCYFKIASMTCNRAMASIC